MSFDKKANLILEKARELAPDVDSWADLSNALFDQQSGLIARTFADPLERDAFLDTEYYEELQGIVDSLVDKFGILAGATPKKSGRFVVRVSKTIHEVLDVEAKREGISLNQLAVTKLSLPLRREKTRLDVSMIAMAYGDTFDGFSIDRVVVDPFLNARFLARCVELSVDGTPFKLNHTLLDIRKSKKAKLPKATKRTVFLDLDDCRFASEIAVRTLQRTKGITLDRILCDPNLAAEFDSIAQALVDESSALKLRWAALNLRKTHQLKPLDSIGPIYDLVSAGPVKRIDLDALPKLMGTYVFYDGNRPLYAGETNNLRKRIMLHTQHGLPSWVDVEEESLTLRYFVEAKFKQEQRLQWLRWFINRERPLLNYQQDAA